MKIYFKISMILCILVISLCSIYGIYDPNNPNPTVKPGEYNILSAPEGSTAIDDNTEIGDVKQEGPEQSILDNTAVANDVTTQEVKEYKAKVMQKIATYKSDIDGVKYQKVKVKVIDKGDYKDKEYEADYVLQILNNPENKELEVGTMVYISFDNSVVNLQRVIVKDIYRIPYLIFALMLFVAIILVIGGKKGIKTIVSLAITFVSIFYILIPSIINGYSAILMSIIVAVVISIITLPLIGGFNKKSLVSILGTILGVMVGGILALLISDLSRITGLSNEYAQSLIYISHDISIDVYGLFFASIIIGTIGATMNITMNIATRMTELKSTSKSELIKSGLNVGRDEMGTMVNTLIFAFVGESLIIILLYILNKSNWVSVINSDYISSEILRALCGIIGMISAIPITVYLYGLIVHTEKNK